MNKWMIWVVKSPYFWINIPQSNPHRKMGVASKGARNGLSARSTPGGNRSFKGPSLENISFGFVSDGDVFLWIRNPSNGKITIKLSFWENVFWNWLFKNLGFPHFLWGRSRSMSSFLVGRVRIFHVQKIEIEQPGIFCYGQWK